MSEEWGPWIEHDGMGRPVASGTIVETERKDGKIATHIAGQSFLEPWTLGCTVIVNAWSWRDCLERGKPSWRIIRYRIRKPRGLTILEGLLENLPEEVDT